MAIIRGTAGNNNLKGTSKSDKIYGYEGNDTLDGGAGIDTLIGGIGNDVYIVDSRTDVIIEKANGGYDTVRSSVSYKLGSNLEKLVLTGSGNRDSRGNELDNLIIGNRGRNILRGDAGNDTLDGSNDDRSDTLYGGVGNDSLIGASKDKLYGEAGDDYLTGEPAEFGIPGNTIYMDGGDGNDYLYSRHDAEMYGGKGNDTVTGGTSVYIDGGDGNDLLDGDESSIDGGKGNDTLTGNYSGLYGGDGDDVLSGIAAMEGGRGNDTLTGGDWDSGFIFSRPTDGIDTITNFAADKGHIIIVSASGFGSELVAGESITTGQLQFGTSAKDADNRFIYDASSGALYFDVDGSVGTHKQIQLAVLVGSPDLTASSIYVTS
ncbi:hypothetical protein IQ230_04130 [Gloeocapsopsis crepidinum LEGE 06123]|uniref:Calcium-binding protein n=1 Tax=Gloeocapsopsis crepidinum LEGE 06123 TaxID=588587 RepID=A0ABR9UMP1_9CHRO|nr:calcium-binding protein [Gloeocapsopsis crepidinum]MBE9189566.1 hypothetical protein [Gloeocapsopsis crepidinum LEGE 06123]